MPRRPDEREDPVRVLPVRVLPVGVLPVGVLPVPPPVDAVATRDVRAGGEPHTSQ
jgi:hypothetical protein